MPSEEWECKVQNGSEAPAEPGNRSSSSVTIPIGLGGSLALPLGYGRRPRQVLLWEYVVGRRPSHATPLRNVGLGYRTIVAFRSAKGRLFAERKATIREPYSAKILNGAAATRRVDDGCAPTRMMSLTFFRETNHATLPYRAACL